MKVTVLGLGQMGAAIAVALVKAGYQTTVWNRSPGKTVEGADHAKTAAEAIAKSPVVIAAVSDHQTARDISGSAKVLINLATGTPEQAKETADWAAERGIDYLDGAMLAVPSNIATPEAHFLYSGSKAVFEDNREMLDLLATSVYLGEDPAVAALWDSALLSVGYATFFGFFHALALLETANTRPSEFVPVARQSLQGLFGFLGELAGEIEKGDYRGGASPVDMNRAVLGSLVGTSLSRGVNAETLTPIRALLDRRSADGHGSDSLSSVIEVLRTGAGRRVQEG
ncbi:NAD(P)-dependent oxidoreductase [Kibdelosporangium aridum]|uniref:3-hydroxyisobutyrate dehydrogenase n=1 Tax=Kibdelosporangium aridum TaxID=2030 RepID=A0A1W2EXJ0_KIBAR|nr:NAD(P)-binding domain-containing protein [Kibdelosporangium aridum]SMD13908.1 3-hydroxyisobutyrate dehydrogenase [Kibdelosporangium aridum]